MIELYLGDAIVPSISHIFGRYKRGHLHHDFSILQSIGGLILMRLAILEEKGLSFEIKHTGGT